MTSWKKRGQGAAGAAVFLAIVTGLIIAFIVAIPPDERAELLGEDSSSSDSNDGIRDIDDTDEDFARARSLENVLQVSPGRIDFLAEDEIDHPLPVVNIFTSTEARILAELNVGILKRGAFTNEKAELAFALVNVDDTEDLLLNFNVEAAQGDLVILFNEQEIYNGPVGVGNIQPISIPENFVQTHNLVQFSVSSPGIAFWKSHEVRLSDVEIVGEVTNRDAESYQTVFLVSETEKSNLEKVRLKFQPDCLYNEVGKLSVYINGNNVYKAVPDCGLAFVPIEISPELIVYGENSIEFSTGRGRYLLSHVVVESELEEVDFPSYFFELSHDEFEEIDTANERLRLKIDFVDVVNRKRGNIVFNGHAIPFDTLEVTEAFDVSEDVVDGTNSLKIRPSKTLDVREVRVDIINN